jgi:hypothetical protein
MPALGWTQFILEGADKRLSNRRKARRWGRSVNRVGRRSTGSRHIRFDRRTRDEWLGAFRFSGANIDNCVHYYLLLIVVYIRRGLERHRFAFDSVSKTAARRLELLAMVFY